MKIVLLDGYTTNPGDLSWDPLKSLGDLTVHDNTPREEILARALDADIVVANAVPFDRETFRSLSRLKLLAVMSTGFSHIDLNAAREFGIAVTNAPGYSTDAVAQHTIALLLELTNQVAFHNESVQGGDYFNAGQDCYFLSPLTLLSGKRLGIIGYGNIGRRVGEIAKALGMTVIPYSQDPEGAQKADVVSLHAPLTEENRHLIDAGFISGMKDGAILLNTARGALTDEAAVADALRSGKLAGAGFDVLTVEPPLKDAENPLLGLANCFITPHNAWMPKETRSQLIQITADAVKSFLNGDRLCRVD